MLGVRATAYEFGPYRLDPLGRSLLRRGEPIALPPKAGNNSGEEYIATVPRRGYRFTADPTAR